MKFNRLFTRADLPIADQIAWRLTDVKSGSTEITGVEIPAQWTQKAANIFAAKYLRKAGVPNKTERHTTNRTASTDEPTWLWPQTPTTNAIFGPETSAKQVFHRLCGHWTYIGWKAGYFRVDNSHTYIDPKHFPADHKGNKFVTEEQSAQTFYDELFYMLANQFAAPNSPQWFNTGLWWAYGIEGPASGQWAVDSDGNPFEMPNAYERPQPHACFIQPVSDDLVNPGGIMDLVVREARLFKQGSGTGTNFSTLRGSNEKLSGGGISSGLMSFLRIGDRSADAIQSGGTTRRAAKMVIVDADHPEIEDFINWKVREEAKAAALYIGSKVIASGVSVEIPEAVLERQDAGFESEIFDIGFMGEAYSTVSGQNSNNSVRVTDDFMTRVEHRDGWNLINRLDGSVSKLVLAEHLWTEISRAAWACADPGLQFHDTINRWHTCKVDGPIRASNPCSEYMFLDNTACNLASLNLCAFLDYDQRTPTTTGFNLAKFEHATRLWMTVLDISNEMASFPSKEIALGTYNYRTTGLGFANLGGLLMRLGLAYDSDAGRSWASGVTALMHGICGLTSGELARELGAFPRFEANKDSMKEVILDHNEIRMNTAFPSVIIGKINEVWSALVFVESFRNAQWTLIAPTGTISFIMGCDDFTGIEPAFSLKTSKVLVGGGSIESSNSAVSEGLTKLGYPAHIRNLILAYIESNGTVDQCEDLKEEHLPIFDCATPPDGFSRCLRPEAHLLMMAAVQPFLSGAISKTVNMPSRATIKDVSRIYKMAHTLGLKSVAIYRDKSKLSQPLQAQKAVEIPRPIKEQLTEIHSQTNQQLTHFPRAMTREEVLVDNKSASLSRSDREYLPWMRTGGFTQKVRIGDFQLFLTANPFPDGRLGEFYMEFAGQGSVMRAMGNLVSILGSLALQHGMPAEKLVEALRGLKFEPGGVVEGDDKIRLVSSVADYVGRKLGSHFLGREDLLDVRELKVVGSESQIVALDKRAIGISHGYSGDVCGPCGSIKMIKNGTCLMCEDCGTTTGCGG